ncbi:MAG: hypothetical protein AAGF99_03840 [Bacteroidota bacterium]
MLRLLLIATLLLPAAAFAQDDDQTPTDPSDALMQARATYQDGNYEACARSYAAAIDLGVVDEGVAFNAACCFALAGDREQAFVYLQQSLDAGWRDVEQLQSDSDLDTLHDDPRWADVVAGTEANEAAYAASINGELYEMYTNDQAERFALMRGELTWDVVTPNDNRRRARVYEMVEAGEIVAAADHLHAAMIFQHGRDSTDYRNARDFAQRAYDLDPSNGTASWLIAAATDRYLWSVDQPQVYGTQSTKGDDGRWTLEPLDEDGVTEVERAARGVTLQGARDRIARMNAQLDAEAAESEDPDEKDASDDESDAAEENEQNDR